MKQKFEIGDLVCFSSVHVLGIIVDVRPAPAFHPEEEIQEAKVRWLEPGGETFWCIDVTLDIISKVKK